jgi:hypothetical protein
MAKNHSKKKNTKAHKYTSPASIPHFGQTIKISSDDPRNSRLRMEQSPNTYKVTSETELDNVQEQDVAEDFWNEDQDPDQWYELDSDPVIVTPEETMEEPSTDYALSAPTNLYVDPSSYTLENNSANSDGVVRWTAYLHFDDVEGAEDYEFVLGASTI